MLLKFTPNCLYLRKLIVQKSCFVPKIFLPQEGYAAKISPEYYSKVPSILTSHMYTHFQLINILIYAIHIIILSLYIEVLLLILQYYYLHTLLLICM